MELRLSFVEHVFHNLSPSGSEFLIFFFFISTPPRLFHLLGVMARPVWDEEQRCWNEVLLSVLVCVMVTEVSVWAEEEDHHPAGATEGRSMPTELF